VQLAGVVVVHVQPVAQSSFDVAESEHVTPSAASAGFEQLPVALSALKVHGVVVDAGYVVVPQVDDDATDEHVVPLSPLHFPVFHSQLFPLEQLSSVVNDLHASVSCAFIIINNKEIVIKTFFFIFFFFNQ
jgi:hypothetical protein